MCVDYTINDKKKLWALNTFSVACGSLSIATECMCPTLKNSDLGITLCWTLNKPLEWSASHGSTGNMKEMERKYGIEFCFLVVIFFVEYSHGLQSFIQGEF